MRILYITTQLNPVDGYGRYGADLIKGVLADGHEVICAVQKSSKQKRAKEFVVLEDVEKYWANIFLIFSTAKKLNKIIKEFNPDVIHFIAEPYAAVLLFLVSRKAKLILTVHGTFVYIPLLINTFFKRIISKIISAVYYRRMTAVITVSSFTRNYLLKFVPTVEDKTLVITNGIDFHQEEVCKEKNDSLQRLLFVGAVKERKGLMEALNGFKLYLSEYTNNAEFNIVGHYDKHDKYYLKLQKWIEDNGLIQNVFFSGRVDQVELNRYYNQADVFLMTPVLFKYRAEGFGLVYLEANMRGVPCIGSRESGALDAINDGVSGYLVNPKDSNEIVEKLDDILNKHQISADDCIDWARKNNIKSKIAEFIELYRNA